MTHEYKNRLETLITFLNKEKLDLAMITDPENIFYYTGFLTNPHERFLALVIDNKIDKVTLFVPALDEEIAIKNSAVTNIIPIYDEENPFAKLQANVSSVISTFGLEKKSVNMFRFEHLQENFPEAAFIDVQPYINSQRIKKTPAEIELIKKPIQIIEEVLAEGIKRVQVGMTELELTAELEYLMRKYGADAPAFTTIVLSEKNSALPHGTPGNRTIQNGDFLLIDAGVKKDGYCSDITRTFVMGEASDKQKEIYDIVLQSNQAGIDAVKAGVPLKNFDIPARKVIQESGYGDYFNYRIGHGLGIGVHEEPSIHEKNNDIAEVGLLFTIEPGIYIPSLGGVRIEDNVYINQEGKAEVLTSFPKDLQII